MTNNPLPLCLAALLLSLTGCMNPWGDHQDHPDPSLMNPSEAAAASEATRAQSATEQEKWVTEEKTSVSPRGHLPWDAAARPPHSPGQTDGAHTVSEDDGWQPSPAPPQIAPPDEALIEIGFPQGLPQKPLAMEIPQYQPWTSGSTIAVRGEEIFVVDEANDHVRILDRSSGQVLHDVPVGARPHQLVVHPDGAVFVTNRHGATVSRIDGEDRDEVLTTTVGVEPWGLALSPDGGVLYVSVAGTGDVVLLAPDSLAEIARLPCFDRPGGMAFSFLGVVAVTQRGDTVRLMVTDEASGLPQAVTAAGDDSCSGMYLEDLRRDQPWDALFHPMREDLVAVNRARSITVDPQTGSLFISHLQTMSGQSDDLFFLSLQMAAELSEGQDGENPFGGDGGLFGEEDGVDYGVGAGLPSDAPHILRPIETTVSTVAACAVCDLPSAWSAPLSDNPTHPAPVKDPLTLEPLSALVDQPVDISHHPTHSLAFVVGKGTDNVLVLNTAIPDPISAPLGILDVGMAPTGIAFSEDGLYAYTLNSQSFDVSMVEIAPLLAMPSTNGKIVGTGDQDTLYVDDGFAGWTSLSQVTGPVRLVHTVVASFGDDPLPEALRPGRRIFTYARNESVSHGGDFACASCHFEGGEDQRVWVIPSGLRQTPTLAQRLDGTAPFNWLGTEDELQTNMSDTIDRMGGTGLTPKELTSLEAFLLQGLVAIPNPHVGASGLTPAQARGAELFHDPTVGCASCHAGAAATDGQLHDVGTINPMELEIQLLVSDFIGVELNLGSFNTPSLRGVFGTAPYLHDGSAATLMDVLERTAITMGYTAHLSVGAKEDLIAYLQTL